MSRRSRIALILATLLVTGLQGSAGAAPTNGFLGAYEWSMTDRRFGGLSGIEVEPDGTSFVALTDRGSWLRGQFMRGQDEEILGIRAGKLAQLKSKAGREMTGFPADSEDLSFAPDGSVYVSFEGYTRVLRYKALAGNAVNLPIPEAFKKLGRNTSLEAMAVDRYGDVYVVPEELPSSKRMRLLIGQPGNPAGKDFPLWKFTKGKWTTAGLLPRRGSFLPVSADFGPDHRLYILERRFLGFGGFASRVRSFVVAASGLQDERTVMESAPGLHDNLEGLSVWKDRFGRIRLTMVSDDNFLPILRSEVVEYFVTD